MAERRRGRAGDERASAARRPVRGHHDARPADGREASGKDDPAIRFVVTDRNSYRPVRTSLLLIDEIRRQHPTDFGWTGTIDRLTGSDKVKKAIEGGTLPALLEEWDREAAAFKASSAPYRLY